MKLIECFISETYLFQLISYPLLTLRKIKCLASLYDSGPPSQRAAITKNGPHGDV